HSQGYVSTFIHFPVKIRMVITIRNLKLCVWKEYLQLFLKTVGKSGIMPEILKIVFCKFSEANMICPYGNGFKITLSAFSLTQENYNLTSIPYDSSTKHAILYPNIGYPRNCPHRVRVCLP